MRGRRIGMLVVLQSVLLLPASPLGAAESPECPAGQTCIWDQPGYRGRMTVISYDCATTVVRSAQNNSPRPEYEYLNVYDGQGCTGGVRTLPPERAADMVGASARRRVCNGPKDYCEQYPDG
jgi:hypothetical protein